MTRDLPPLKALRVFEVAAQMVSFTKAAEELNLTQSAVSKQVKLLEEYFQTPLFRRNNNQLQLTEAGQLFFLNIKPILDSIENTSLEIASHQKKHHLNVAAPPTFMQRWLLPRLPHFWSYYPSTNLYFHTIYDYSLLEKKTQDFDVIIFYGDGSLKNMPSSPLMTEKHISVCSPKILQKNNDKIIDLSQHTLIHLARESRAYLLWERWLKAAKIDLFSTQRGLWFDNFETMILAAIQSYGFAIVDKNMVQTELEEGLLVQWNPTELSFPLGYWLLLPSDRPTNPALVGFRDFLMQER